MSIKVFVELHVQEEKLQEILPLFSKLLPQTRSREGNEGVTIYADQDAPTTIVLVEQWASREQYETYNQWRADRGDLSNLAELLQEPPQRRFFDHLAV